MLVPELLTERPFALGCLARRHDLSLLRLCQFTTQLGHLRQVRVDQLLLIGNPIFGKPRASLRASAVSMRRCSSKQSSSSCNACCAASCCWSLRHVQPLQLRVHGIGEWSSTDDCTRMSTQVLSHRRLADWVKSISRLRVVFPFKHGRDAYCFENLPPLLSLFL